MEYSILAVTQESSSSPGVFAAIVGVVFVGFGVAGALYSKPISQLMRQRTLEMSERRRLIPMPVVKLRAAFPSAGFVRVFGILFLLIGFAAIAASVRMLVLE
ncbi:hypothetical protein [Streptomyces montanisoli]|uniref:Uncharacterized protein n=1 Tax=Streptomyces montanisoli TaxID=2798581 RepID=A0A940MIF4_9ACTN|nr:hypothetical protein [Streptomyces montanisoli]MBP0459841.1 hypothetical protein [Streptomyces montanisoli]